MLCKTYCFAFQKRRFCTVKAALLQRKTAAFAMPKRSYQFLRELSLQKQSCFIDLAYSAKLEIISLIRFNRVD